MKTKKPAPLLNPDEKHLDNNFSATGLAVTYRTYDDGSGDSKVIVICDTLKKWVCAQSIDTLKTLFLCKRNRLVESKKTSNNKQHIDFRVK